MKKIFTSFALLAAVSVAQAQTTAVNWTANDCSSVSHTLHTELDAGKVIVFDWVMPCGSCVPPSKTAYNIVQSYAASHPGKVLFYMADDLGDDNCNDLTTWINANNIGDVSKMTLFGNAGNVINESQFGGTGMPHIIVMGTSNHTIFFNKKNTAADDAPGIQAAINAALGALSVAEVNKVSFSITPNPVSETFNVNYAQPVKSLIVTSLNGQVIKEETYGAGKINPSLDISELAAGMYLIKITDVDGKAGVEKIVKQ